MNTQALPVELLADSNAGHSLALPGTHFPPDLILRFEFGGQDDNGSPSGATLFVFGSKRLQAHWEEGSWSADAMKLPIKLDKAHLEGQIRKCTAVWWREVVEATSIIGGENCYTYHVQTQFEPTAKFKSGVLSRLATAGQSLLVQLFGIGNKHYQRTHDFARVLSKALLAEEELRIVVQGSSFFVPWNLIYFGDDVNTPDPAHFLGARHVVEHDVDGAEVFDDAMPMPEEVAVQFDRNIDVEDKTAPHLAVGDFDLLLKQYGLAPIERSTKRQFLQALRGGVKESFLYFLCHGTAGDDLRVNSDDTVLFLTSDEGPNYDGISSADIDRELFAGGPLVGRPVVFINSCRGLKSGSLYYSGFAPSFLEKDARAVIGPEIEMPVMFAKEFSRRFFEEFFRGGREFSIGRVLLRLRRDFLLNHANPLGLAYSLYRGASHYLPISVLPRSSFHQPPQDAN